MIAQCIQGAVPNMMVTRFNETLMEFLVNLRNVFPEYALKFTTAINELQLGLSMGSEDLALKTFQLVLGADGYHKCVCKDEQFVFRLFKDVGFLKDFNITDIWSQCPREVKDNIWLYLLELAGLIQSYTKASKSSTEDVVRKMQDLDKKVEGMLQTGMNPNDVLSSLLAAKTN